MVSTKAVDINNNLVGWLVECPLNFSTIMLPINSHQGDGQ